MHTLLLAIAVSLLATPAHALGIFGELITPGHRDTLDAKVDGGPWNLQAADWTRAADSSLGDGWVSSGEWLTWTHSFAPGFSGARLEEAWLVVGMSDYDLHREKAELHLGGDLWQRRSFWFADFAGGDVLSAITGNELVVSVRATQGSFKVAGSLFKAKYSSAPPIPEPHAALVFGLGGAIVLWTLRRRLLPA